MDFKRKIEILVSELTSKGLNNLKKQLSEIDSLLKNFNLKALDGLKPVSIKADIDKESINKLKSQKRVFEDTLKGAKLGNIDVSEAKKAGEELKNLFTASLNSGTISTQRFNNEIDVIQNKLKNVQSAIDKTRQKQSINDNKVKQRDQKNSEVEAFKEYREYISLARSENILYGRSIDALRQKLLDEGKSLDEVNREIKENTNLKQNHIATNNSLATAESRLQKAFKDGSISNAVYKKGLIDIQAQKQLLDNRLNNATPIRAFSNNLISGFRGISRELDAVLNALDFMSELLEQGGGALGQGIRAITPQRAAKKEIAKELLAARPSLANNTSSTIAGTQALEKSNESLKISYEKLSSSSKAAGESLGLYGRISQGVAGLTAGLTNAVKGLWATLLSNPLTGIIAGVAALGVALGKGVGEASKYEAQLRQLSALTGITGTDLQKLRVDIDDLASSVSEFSKADIVSATTEILKQGVNNVDDALKIAEASLKLSQATGEAVATTTDVTLSTLQQFKLGVDDIPSITDRLAAGANNSATSVQGLGEALKFVGPVGANTNQSLTDIIASIALLTNNGLKAEQAGTGLRGILVRLVKPTRQVEEAFKKANISTNDLRTADGKLKPLVDIFTILRKKTEGWAEADKARLATQVAGTESLPAFLTLLNDTQNKFGTLQEAVANSNGEIEKMALITSGGVIASFRAFKNEIINAFSSLGEPFIGIVSGVLSTIRAFGLFIGETVKLIGEVTLVNDILRFFGINIATAGSSLLSVAKAYSDFVSEVQRVKLEIQEFFSTILQSAPFQVMADAIDKVGQSLSGFVGAIGRALAVFASLTAVQVVLGGIFRFALAGLVSLGASIQVFTRIVIAQAIPAIMAGLNGLYIAFTTRLVPAVIAGIRAIQIAFAANWIGATIQAIIIAVSLLVAIFPKAFKDILDVFMGFASDWGAGWQAIVDITKGSWDLILGYINVAIGAILGATGGFLGKIAGGFTGTFKAIQVLIQRFAQKAPIVFRSFAQNVANIFTALGEHIKNSFAGIIKAVLTGDVKGLQGALSKAFTGFKLPAISVAGFGDITEGLDGIVSQYAKAGEQAGKKWGDGFTKQGSKQVARGNEQVSKSVAGLAERGGKGKTKNKAGGNNNDDTDGANGAGKNKGGGGKDQKDKEKSTIKDNTELAISKEELALKEKIADIESKINKIENDRLKTNRDISLAIFEQEKAIDRLETANKELDIANAKLDTQLAQGIITEAQAKELKLDNEKKRIENEKQKAYEQYQIALKEISKLQVDKQLAEDKGKLEISKLEAEKVTNDAKLAILKEALNKTKDTKIKEDFGKQIAELETATKTLKQTIGAKTASLKTELQGLADGLQKASYEAENKQLNALQDYQLSNQKLITDEINARKEASADMRDAFSGGAKDAVKAFISGDFASIGKAIANAFNNFISKSVDKLIDGLFNGQGFNIGNIFGGGGSDAGGGGIPKTGVDLLDIDGGKRFSGLRNDNQIFDKVAGKLVNVDDALGQFGNTCTQATSGLGGFLGRLGSGLKGIFTGKGFSGFKEGGGIGGAGLGGILGIGAGLIGGIFGFIKNRKAKKKAKREAKLQAEIENFKAFVDARLVEIEQAQQAVSDAQAELLANTPRGLANVNKAILGQLAVINQKRQDITNKFNSLSGAARQRAEADFNKTIQDLDKQITQLNKDTQKNYLDIGKQLLEFNNEIFLNDFDKELRGLGKEFFDLESRRFDLKEAGYNFATVDKLIDSQIKELRTENAKKFAEKREELLQANIDSLKDDLSSLNSALDGVLQEFGFKKKATSDVKLQNAIMDFRLKRKIAQDNLKINLNQSLLESLKEQTAIDKSVQRAREEAVFKGLSGGTENYLTGIGQLASNQINGYQLQIPQQIMNQGVSQITNAINNAMSNSIQSQFQTQFADLLNKLSKGGYGV